METRLRAPRGPEDTTPHYSGATDHFALAAAMSRNWTVGLIAYITLWWAVCGGFLDLQSHFSYSGMCLLDLPVVSATGVMALLDAAHDTRLMRSIGGFLRRSSLAVCAITAIATVAAIFFACDVLRELFKCYCMPLLHGPLPPP